MGMNDNEYKVAGEILRTIMQENGPDILKKPIELGEKLAKYGCDETVRYQILLVVQASNVTNYIPQQTTGISMIEVNNIVSCAERETGLSKRTVKTVLGCILYGLSLPTELESVAIPDSGTGFDTLDTAISDYAEHKALIGRGRKAIIDEDGDTIREIAEELSRAANAGNPDALYIIGVCYYNGIGITADRERAHRYLVSAAGAGSAQASISLGDHYFENQIPDYTRAFSYYTAIGAASLTQQRQDNVKAILQERSTNITTLVLSFVLLAAAVVFDFLLGSGTFSVDGATHWVCAVMALLLSVAVFGLAVFSFIVKRYNSVKWVVPGIVVVTMLFAMIAL